MEKIQFNYDLWVNNKDKYDLVTRDGRPAKVYHYDPTNNVDYRIIGCVDNEVASWSVNGEFFSDNGANNKDLMMVEKKQTKTYKEIVGAVRYPRSGLLNIEVCPFEDKEAIEDAFNKEGFDYQIKEIEFEF